MGGMKQSLATATIGFIGANLSMEQLIPYMAMEYSHSMYMCLDLTYKLKTTRLALQFCFTFKTTPKHSTVHTLGCKISVPYASMHAVSQNQPFMPLSSYNCYISGIASILATNHTTCMQV